MDDVYNNLYIELLEVHTETHLANTWRLFRASSATLRQILKVLRKEFSWEDLKFVPHSLRYGGDVHNKIVRKLHFFDIQQRDWWKNPETFLSYIQKRLGRLFYSEFSASSSKPL